MGCPSPLRIEGSSLKVDKPRNSATHAASATPDLFPAMWHKCPMTGTKFMLLGDEVNVCDLLV